MVAPKERSRGSVLLEKVIDEGGETAEAVKAAFHRTQLWRYIARESHYARPDWERAKKLEELTNGQVTVASWSEPAETEQGAA